MRIDNIWHERDEPYACPECNRCEGELHSLLCSEAKIETDEDGRYVMNEIERPDPEVAREQAEELAWEDGR